MKRILLTLALVLPCVFSHAQKNEVMAPGIRYELVQTRQNDNSYSLFKYKDAEADGGAVGYYLSLAYELDMISLVTDMSNTSFSHVAECILCLGSTTEEATETLQDLLELTSENAGATREYACRATNGVGLLAPGTVTAVVNKGIFGSKRLAFSFVQQGRQVSVDVGKGDLKSLLSSFKLVKKLHPDW